MDTTRYLEISNKLKNDVYRQLDSDFIELLYDDIDSCYHEDEEGNPIEILEVYAISERLAQLLLSQGGICVEYYGLWIWCRTISGQAIWLDSIMENAYEVSKSLDDLFE